MTIYSEFQVSPGYRVKSYLRKTKQPTWRQRQEDEIEASLVYRASSRTAKAEKPCLEKRSVHTLLEQGSTDTSEAENRGAEVSWKSAQVAKLLAIMGDITRISSWITGCH